MFGQLFAYYECKYKAHIFTRPSDDWSRHRSAGGQLRPVHTCSLQHKLAHHWFANPFFSLKSIGPGRVIESSRFHALLLMIEANQSLDAMWQLGCRLALASRMPTNQWCAFKKKQKNLSTHWKPPHQNDKTTTTATNEEQEHNQWNDEPTRLFFPSCPFADGCWWIRPCWAYAMWRPFSSLLLLSSFTNFAIHFATLYSLGILATESEQNNSSYFSFSLPSSGRLGRLARI